MRPLPVVLVLALALPGCIAGLDDAAPADALDGLSPVRFDQVLAEPFPMTMADGAVMDAWVFRPDVGASGDKVPVVINFSPYWSNLAPPAASGGDAFSQYLIDYLVPRGYAVALVSARGTGLSDGCFIIGGTTEIDDEDAIATILGEQPWSNGAVAAIAKSYDGTMAQGLLTRNNPYVKTIVPVSPISEFYKYNYYGGVPYTDGGTSFNTYYVAEVSAAQSDDPTSESWSKTPTRFCAESIDVQTNQYRSVALGDYTPYWQARNYTALLPDEIDASVFYVHGLQDWNVKPDHMTPWIDELRARNVTVKMQLGQWGHEYSNRDDWNSTLLRWFDSELKGIDTGIRAEPLVEVQDNEGVWRDEAEWPPARAARTTLYPSEDGALGLTPGSGASAYGDAPGGALGALPAGAGPVSVVFETAPFERTMRIAGVPELHARVSATGVRATLAAALLVDGVVVDQGFLDLAHRDGLESASPMTPGATYDVVVPLYPQDLVVPAGAKLSLLLSSTSPPDAPVSVTPASAGGLVTIAHGEGTWLSLPMIEGDDVEIESPQPEDVGCWAC